MAKRYINLPPVANLVANAKVALPILADIDSRTPGLALAIVQVAQHESKFDPTARLTMKNPDGSILADVGGLLQWVGATAKRFGVPGVGAVISLGLAGQLTLAEVYSRAVLGSLAPTGWHLWARGWGYGGNPEASDDTVVYAAGTAGARANKTMNSADGTIRLGTLRNHWNAWVAKLPKAVAMEVPDTLPLVVSPSPSPSLESGSCSLPVLRLGCEGIAVGAFQALVDLPVTGQFGAVEKAAASKLQAEHNLEIDGIVGPHTWAVVVVKENA
jgi:hypothetical protein